MPIARRSRIVVFLLVAGAILLTPGSLWAQAEKEAPPAEEPAAESEAAIEPEVKEAINGTATVEEEPAYDILTTKRLTGDWGGVRTDLEEKGITFSILLDTASQWNLKGGLNTTGASDYTGKAFYNVILNFEDMGLIEGGEFFGRVIQTWGDGIQSDVGSVGPPFLSTGSSGDRAFEIDKYWWRQRLFDDRIEFRLGKLSSNADLFDQNKYADSYVSKFANRVLYTNLTIPSTKGVGAFVKVWPVDWLYLETAGVDPDSPNSKNRHGTGGWDTVFDGNMRFRGFWEAGLLPHYFDNAGLLEGNYRVGFWYDPVDRTRYPKGSSPGGTQGQQLGFYLSFDQFVWKEVDDIKDKQGLGVFARYGFAHPEYNRFEHAWNLGAVYTGLIPTRDKDTIGLGIAQSIPSDYYESAVDANAHRETVYELYYAFHLTPWCVITPDLQYIANPGATTDNRDAIVGGIRMRFSF